MYVHIHYYFIYAKSECVWPVLALMRTSPRMRGPPSGSLSLFLFFSICIFLPLRTRDFSTPDRER